MGSAAAEAAHCGHGSVPQCNCIVMPKCAAVGSFTVLDLDRVQPGASNRSTKTGGRRPALRSRPGCQFLGLPSPTPSLALPATFGD
jgi:hypothetical protein